MTERTEELGVQLYDLRIRIDSLAQQSSSHPSVQARIDDEIANLWAQYQHVEQAFETAWAQEHAYGGCR